MTFFRAILFIPKLLLLKLLSLSLSSHISLVHFLSEICNQWNCYQFNQCSTSQQWFVWIGPSSDLSLCFCGYKCVAVRFRLIAFCLLKTFNSHGLFTIPYSAIWCSLMDINPTCFTRKGHKMSCNASNKLLGYFQVLRLPTCLLSLLNPFFVLCVSIFAMQLLL